MSTADVVEPPSSPQPQFSLVPLRQIWPQEIAFLFPTKDCIASPQENNTLYKQQMQVKRLWRDMMYRFGRGEVPKNFAGYQACNSDYFATRADAYAEEHDTWKNKRAKRPEGYIGSYNKYYFGLVSLGYPKVGSVEYYFPGRCCHHAKELQLLLAQLWDPTGDWVIYGGWAFAHSTIVCRRTLRVFDALLEPLGMSAEKIIAFVHEHGGRTPMLLRPRPLISKSN